MYIHEAIAARTEKQPFITRRAWRNVVTARPTAGAAFKVQPTDTPDCCIMYGPHTLDGVRCWNPQMSDLRADDWEVVE